MTKRQCDNDDDDGYDGDDDDYNDDDDDDNHGVVEIGIPPTALLN